MPCCFSIYFLVVITFSIQTELLSIRENEGGGGKKKLNAFEEILVGLRQSFTL